MYTPYEGLGLRRRTGAENRDIMLVSQTAEKLISQYQKGQGDLKDAKLPRHGKTTHWASPRCGEERHNALVADG